MDNDPVVLVYSRALLSDTPQGRTTYIDADLRDPGAILSHPALAATLDLSRPVGLLLVAVAHFLHDDDQPYDVVRSLATSCRPAASSRSATPRTTSCRRNSPRG